MKKMMFSLALIVAATLSAPAQILYKITGNGLQKPSFIIGTYHLAPVSFVDSIPGVKAALETAEQACGEVEISELTSNESVQKMQAAMMLPEGQTLDKLLSADELSRLNALLKDLLGVDLSNPMVAQQLGRMSPQGLSTQLTVLMYLKKNPDFNPLSPFDGYFQQQMVQAGKPVKGFETVDFQVDVLFNGTPMEDQVKGLMCVVDNREWQEQMADDVVSAFFSQDLKAIEDALERKMGNDCDDKPEERDRLIYNRNANWLKMMPQMMSEKSTFFAVGAAHLVGEKGVLEGLRKAGYQVEGMK